MNEHYEDVLIGKINHAIVGITKLEKDLAFTRKDNVTLKDKLKEAVGILKRTQYVYNGYNGSPCHECLCQEGETHNPDCRLNNFIKDNQGE